MALPTERNTQYNPLTGFSQPTTPPPTTGAIPYSNNLGMQSGSTQATNGNLPTFPNSPGYGQRPPALPTTPVSTNALSNQNPQNIQNYMTALNNVGAGNNNAEDSSRAPVQQTATPLYAANSNASQTLPTATPYRDPTAYNSGPPPIMRTLSGQSQINPYAVNTGQLPGSAGSGGNGSLVIPMGQPPADTVNTPTNYGTNPLLGGQPNPLVVNTGSLPGSAGSGGNGSLVIPMGQPPANTTNTSTNYGTNPTTGGTLPYTGNTGQLPGNAGTSSNLGYNYGYPPLKSDVRDKTDITPADKELDTWLNAMGAHSYEYKKPEEDGVGRFVSPMAQELQKTPIGKSMVVERPDGKLAVDYQRGFGFLMSAQSYMNKRLNEIEKGFSLTKKRK